LPGLYTHFSVQRAAAADLLVARQLYRHRRYARIDMLI
jgi:hypothetical protein